MSREIKLNTSIQAHGEDINVLKLRELNTEDIMRCGYPMSFKGEGDDMEMILNTAIAAKYIERLAGIPAGSVKQLSPADFQNAMMAVVHFFGESAATL